MKKAGKIVLISVASVFVLLSSFVLGVVINGNCFEKYKEDKLDQVNWMSRISDEKKINEIVIPGSHDSGCYNMSYLGETQYLTIKEQLDVGVRYFDIRVNKDHDKYVIFHSIINGVEFDPILDDIKSFLDTNNTETLLLDFQHFNNGADAYVYEKLSLKLGDYLLSNNTAKNDLEYVSSLTLKDTRGKCLVFFGDDSKYCSNAEILSRNNDACTNKGCALDSMYETERNSKDSKTYINESIPFYIEGIKNKINNEGHKGIFVLQCQLTDGKLIFGPYSKEKKHDKNMSEFINSLKDKEYFNLINVLMRDFIDYDICNDIINLNF